MILCLRSVQLPIAEVDPGNLTVLTRLNNEIRHARERAGECARKAQEAQTEEARKDFLALQHHWLALASRYEVSASVTYCANDAARDRKPLIIQPPFPV